MPERSTLASLPRSGRGMPPRPPAPRPLTAVAVTPPVYQWRYKLGKNGHVSAWMDVHESAGYHVGYGTNRITDVEFRIKPQREVCEVELRVTGEDGAHYHRCIREQGHGAELKHLTKVGGYAVEWV